MQRYGDTQILYSPSDLVVFLECNHASFLDMMNLNTPLEKTAPDATMELIAQKGLEHEADYLRVLQEQGKRVVEIPKGELQTRADLTLAAMRDGADVIFQAVFFNNPWRGDADFLMKCDTPSDLGDYSYEVIDTKLARTARPKHIIQLCAYSDFLTDLQGIRPANIHVFGGDGQMHSFRLDDFFHYYQRAKKRFIAYVQNPPGESYPEPCNHCNLCKWSDRCNERWLADNHLSFVANIQRSQMDKLRAGGIKTVGELADAPDEKVPDLNHDVFLRLRAQARLQHHKATTGEDIFETIPFDLGKGFTRIPTPNNGDLFFDMEGDPLHPDGLEYLFGVYYFDGDKEKFLPFWGHDHVEEKEAFKDFMAFVGEHLTAHPTAYIYHYNHYETTALKRLACRYALCEEQLDNLLRNEKFVDLYLVVRESIRTSEPSYSIKNMETFYMEARGDDVGNAMDSIVAYNNWRKSGDNIILQGIEDYNKTDCVSTYLLRNWLTSIKPANTPWFNELPDRADDTPLERKDWEIDYDNYKGRLGVIGENPPALKERLSHLLEFHNREDKPKWWAMFDRQNKFEDELIDDNECIGGLRLIGEPEPEARSLIYTYQFPPQDYKLKLGSQAVNTTTANRAGSIVELNDTACILKIKRGAAGEPLPDYLSIGPSGPINSKVIRESIYRYADHLINTPDTPHVATELLNRTAPRINGREAGAPIITSNNLQGDALAAILAMDNSCLFIQGPPGAGKTHTSGHLIVDLIAQGKKVGVASNSHKAIHNLLDKIEAVAREKNIPFQGIKKASRSNPETEYNGQFISTETSMDNINLGANLFAGTAWLFSDPYFNHQLDYLFIDEAGQLATARVVAMANATQNIILVGDQMQLGQPIQGTHPGEAGLSVLEFLLGDHATIPVERGIFLDNTYRMHPRICQFISDAFYDGRLRANDVTAQRSLDLQNIGLPNEGIVLIEAEHTGCSQKSVEEGVIINTHYRALLGQTFTDTDGTTRPITPNDILVIAPYNVQVNYLKTLLPEARVGTIDKFQGQEAPIVLLSMVTSSAEDLPRNIEFLYSKRRLNVAISRAQCLTIVVANPKLMEIPCKTVEQMKLVSTFCRLDAFRFPRGAPIL